MLRLEKLSVSAGEFSLADVSFEVPAGDCAVLMGPTGCGKTTLLETICGLRPPTSGRIWLGSRDITSVAVSRRRIGYVPQDGALFPKMTVRENLAFPRLVRREKQAAVQQSVNRLAERLSLNHLLDRRATGLSGGEAQRVALGRALSSEPELLLLDEPLSALDESTRAEMIQLLEAVRLEANITTVYVTHSSTESARLADQLLVISDGRLKQRATSPASETPREGTLPELAT